MIITLITSASSYQTDMKCLDMPQIFTWIYLVKLVKCFTIVINELLEISYQMQ